MLTHHTGFEQRTESWDRARRGYITASSAKRLVTAGGKESSQWRTYAAELATEIFLAENISSFHGNQHTKRGEMLEKPAQEWFARQLGIQSIPESALPAFVCDEETQCGFSPDMLFPEYGVETKAQEAKKHFTDILGWRNGKTVAQDFYPQLQFSMMVSGLPSWIILFYHPSLSVHERILRDETYISMLREVAEKTRLKRETDLKILMDMLVEAERF